MKVKVVEGGGKTELTERWEDRGPGGGSPRQGHKAGGGRQVYGTKAPPSVTGGGRRES